jgi:hypothetical protein
VRARRDGGLEGWGWVEDSAIAGGKAAGSFLRVGFAFDFFFLPRPGSFFAAKEKN